MIIQQGWGVPPEETLLYDHGTGAASSLKTLVALSAKYVYDGDGNMVMSIINGVITATGRGSCFENPILFAGCTYPGRHYQKEVNGETVTTKKYYAAVGHPSLDFAEIWGGNEGGVFFVVKVAAGSKPAHPATSLKMTQNFIMQISDKMSLHS